MPMGHAAHATRKIRRALVNDICVHDFQLLLTHLAGVHHLGREALRMRLLRRARSQAPRLFPGDLERESLAGSDGSRSE